MIDRQIEKLNLGKVHRHNILWSSCKKFYPTGLEVMEKRLWKDGRTDGRTCTRSGNYIYMCLSVRSHKKSQVLSYSFTVDTTAFPLGATAVGSGSIL